MRDALIVNNLTLSVPSSKGRVTVVDDVSFDIPAGTKVGLVGESGSGKSLTAYSLMRLIKDPVRIDKGEIFLGDKEILGMSMKEFRHMRGNDISMIYQDPMSALNPIMRIGAQIIESIQLHSDVDHTQARKLAIEHLASVGIPEPDRRIDSYPFEMSGGMLQRVVIAIALSGEPKVLIADEATTALDVTTQDRVLTLIDKLAAERGLSVLLITHDLGVAAQFSDEIMVMYAGKLVERGSVDQIFSHPVHPYTKALLDSRCDYTIDVTKPINSIAGQPPRPDNRPEGCVFSPRCEHVQHQCREGVPSLLSVQDRLAACFRADELYRVGMVH
ncbi:MAG: ABC transporter ATP-binding protein [Candidatus Nanopelagicaceae bacterium]|nr:ABC transporter ATP-binding protein [Candidatus Nanopelagicaceae bacterium]